MKSIERVQVSAEQLPSVHEEADHGEGRPNLDLERAVGATHPGAFALSSALTQTSGCVV